VIVLSLPSRRRRLYNFYNHFSKCYTEERK